MKNFSKILPPVYNQSNSNPIEVIISGKTSVKNFSDNLDKAINSRISVYEDGSIEDYSPYQEQRNLEKYKIFLSSFAYDDIKEAEFEIAKTLTLTKLRKIVSLGDD